MRTKIILVIVVLTMVASFGVPAAATDNTVYFSPHESNASYCHTAEVEIWVNATEFQGGQIKLTYDPACANVINWEKNNASFSLGEWDHYDGMEWITFANATTPLNGNYMIGKLTIHCICNNGCDTELAFIEPSSKLFDDAGYPDTINWINGTFTCLKSEEAIPEFSTIAIPVSAIIGLFILMRWRRRD